MSAVSAGISEVLIKYTGKYVKIYFIMKITYSFMITEEMVVEPARLSKKNKGEENHVADHPLNPNPDSEWGSFFKDNEVLTQIDKDVRYVYLLYFVF